VRISRIRIKNFANFSDFDVSTGDSLVIVGENKVGKSNLVFALQLVLDPSLSERDRQLSLDHFWDGLGDDKLGSTIEIAVDLTNYDDDARLIAHLGDCIVDPGPPMVSRLTYRFQPKNGLNGTPTSLADYEYVIFGGLDTENIVRPSIRRMLPLDVMVALRDVEKDLATWRRSPLRPLIETMAGSLDEAAREEIQAQVNAAQAELAEHEEVAVAAQTISQRLIDMVGPQHATTVSLGLSPTRVDALLRALRLLIDNRSRGIADASLGTANLIFLALKSLELDQLVQDGERDHTFFAVEEPEAHLHPHVQRLIYRYFFNGNDDESDDISRITTILTTHSPHIASVAPLRSIVLLRHNATSASTIGVSTANAPLTESDEADLQRYIDVTRGELFFARGIILVEGDAERFLIPAFANILGIHLDELGISVCSVSGTNFAPYVKLLGHTGLDIPHVVLTDRDPNGTKQPRARRRLISLLEIVEDGLDYSDMGADDIFSYAEQFGYFVNSNTLEPELFAAGLSEAMQDVIVNELRLSESTSALLQGWVDDPDTLDSDRLITLIERIGKGRFAQSLAAHVTDDVCPTYIRIALEHIRDATS
jgi:putative ATP-dependent endonuclease of OLD family